MTTTQGIFDLAVVGGGNMGEALLSGLLGGDEPLLDAGRTAVVELSSERAEYLRKRFGVTTVDIGQAAREAETVVILVKPYHVDGVLAGMTDHVTDGQLIISAAGGITTAQIERGLTAKAAVVRCAPNTAVSVGLGMTAMSAGTHADARHLDRTRELLASVGRVVEVPEYQLDAVTALSGAGPAYFFYLAEALTEAGVLLGLSRPLAEELATQTAAGAGVMLRDSDDDAIRLRAAVTSPGGVTIAGIRELENHGVRSAVMAAAAAGRARSEEMGRQGSGHG